MDSLHLICPHCGLKMELVLQGKPSSLVVFVCARCKEPLMRFEGEVFELDKKEFEVLRKKLSPIIASLQENPLAEEIQIEKPIRKGISEETVQELMKILDECKDVSEFIDKI